MSEKENPIDKIETAMQYAFTHRPKIGGFPFLAECLRQAGVTKNTWSLPSTQSVYIMKDGVVVQQGKPLIEGMHQVPPYNKTALISALRKDQAGESTFPDFLAATWQAGVIYYEVNFIDRSVVYRSAKGESYTETYPAVEVKGLKF